MPCDQEYFLSKEKCEDQRPDTLSSKSGLAKKNPAQQLLDSLTQGSLQKNYIL